MPSSYYEIRVSGVLPPEALLDFDRLTASVEPVETVVHGALQDQAALNGLLARLEAFGVEVSRRSRPRPRPSAAPSQSSTMLDQLNQLAALHQQGVLTDDEFSAAKAKLFGT